AVPGKILETYAVRLPACGTALSAIEPVCRYNAVGLAARSCMGGHLLPPVVLPRSALGRADCPRACTAGYADRPGCRFGALPDRPWRRQLFRPGRFFPRAACFLWRGLFCNRIHPQRRVLRAPV